MASTSTVARRLLVASGPAAGFRRSSATTALASCRSSSAAAASLSSVYQPYNHHHQAQRPISRRYMGTWPKVRPKRIRVITMDVTGTLVSFKGTLEQHYLGSALSCGIELPPDTDKHIGKAFSDAYKEVSLEYPCFGGDTISAKRWWRTCVRRSFELVGATMTEHQQDQVFQRIYSTFGSMAAYEIFDDATPFLHWAQRKHIVCGILSNADERYGDSILPMLGVTPDDIQFQLYSKDCKIEKPSPRFFSKCMSRADPFLFSPSEDDPLLAAHVLHVGNDWTKDFEGARRAGMHACLLDRYGEPENVAEWKRRGALVFEDLMDIVEFLGRSNCHLG